MKTIALSDIHLGSEVCQAKLLHRLLEEIHHNNSVKRLIINGDLFDNSNLDRLNKHHWHVLSIIRKMSDDIEIIYIRGNHDLPAELMSVLLGVDVLDEYILHDGGKRILFHHGHRFDKFIDKHKILTWLADKAYWALQKIDSSFRLARQAKQASKTYLRISQIIENKSIEYAKKINCHAVCTGHTHLPLHKPGYYNSGSWAELPCHFLSIENGIVELHDYE